MKSAYRLIYVKEGLTLEECQNKVVDKNIYYELLENGFFVDKRFAFVGVYSCRERLNKNTTIIGYPKYINENEQDKIAEHMNLVCRVIEKVAKKDSKILVNNQEFDSYSIQGSKKRVDLYNLADFILKYYMENGLYNCKLKKNKTNGNGPVKWSHTINKLKPIIDMDSIIYTSTINRVTENDFSQLITNLHCWILNQCYHYIMEPLGKFKGLVLPEIIQNFGEDLVKYSPIINKYLSRTFSSRDITLLKALAAWCDESPYHKKRVIGVTCFDRVWEYTTKLVFGNLDDTESGKPTYTIYENTYTGTGTANPDILNAFEFGNSKCLLILDAKYYFPKLFTNKSLSNEAIVIGLPANSDVVKQVDYYNSLKQRYNGLICGFANAFLLPEFTSSHKLTEVTLEHTIYRKIGYAKRSRPPKEDPVLRKLALNDVNGDRYSIFDDFVLLFEINPNKLYNAILNDERIQHKELYEDFIKPFGNQMSKVKDQSNLE